MPSTDPASSAAAASGRMDDPPAPTLQDPVVLAPTEPQLTGPHVHATGGSDTGAPNGPVTGDEFGGGGPSDRGEEGSHDRPAVGEYIFAAVTALTGAGVIGGAFTINIPVSSEPLGPRAMPLIIGVTMTVVSLWILVQLVRGVRGQAEDSEDIDRHAPTEWGTLAAIVALVAIHAALIEPAGWPIAAMVLFWGVGLALGARPWWKPALIAVPLALLLQFVFAHLLGVTLPAGLLEAVEFLHG